ncbi:MAG: 4Fe-4S binding protein, partial [Bacteroidota bacterium]
AAARDEIDVVFPIYNREGRGILGGGPAEMAGAIAACHTAGKGVYLMKVLGGGTLFANYAGLVDHARHAVPSHSIAVGMVTEAEVDYNIAFFTGEAAGRPLPDLKGLEKQVKVVTGLCRGCGTCLPACHSAAITLSAGKACIDTEACLRCGYCTAACPEFAIRVM